VALTDRNLQSMLETGSSRVFNCNDIAKKLVELKDPDPYFFKSPAMNVLVLIKEAIVDDRAMRRMKGEIVGTKLYFPYDSDDIYGGGRSVYLHDDKLTRVIQEILGTAGQMDGIALEHDMAILEIVDKLPSLDGFLMRDALEIRGMKPNPKYFEVPENEHRAIREFIRKKFDPLVKIAYAGMPNANAKAMNLVEKMWEATDLDSLAPLIRAFRFPEEDALEIFSAWKGINFYSFQYVRSKPSRENFALWLRDNAKPRGYVPSAVMEHFDLLRKATIRKLRFHWQAVEEITREYDSLYGAMLSRPDAAPAFVEFLHRGRSLYWKMGNSLSKIAHAVTCWKEITQGSSGRPLAADMLERLLTNLNQILAGEEPNANEIRAA
jgi:hypothetical protein